MTSAAASSVELQMLLFTAKICRAKTDSDGAMGCCDEVTQLLARLQLKILLFTFWFLPSSQHIESVPFPTSTCIRVLEAAVNDTFIAHHTDYSRFKYWQPLRTSHRSSHSSHPSRASLQQEHW